MKNGPLNKEEKKISTNVFGREKVTEVHDILKYSF